MSTFLNFTIIGIVYGCIYALTASGLVVTYTTSGIFNFAHGAISMIAAWLFWGLRYQWHWPTPLAIAAVLFVFAPLFGAVIERVLVRPLHGAAVDLPLVVTLGLFLFLIGLTNVVWKQTRRYTLPAFYNGRSWRVLGFNLTYNEVIVVVVAIGAAILLRLLFSRTRIGVAMRAVVDNPDLVAMAGAPPARIRQLSWALGSMMAALAGVLLGPLLTLTVVFLSLSVINGYAAAVVGRLKSLPMTVLGAFVVGLGYSYSVGYSSRLISVLGISPHSKPGQWLGSIQLVVPMIVLFVVVIALRGERLRMSQVATVSAPKPASLRSSLAGGAALVAAAALVAPFLSTTQLKDASNGLALAFIMLSLVLLTGYGGMVSLCQMTFAGIGAYEMGHVGGSGGSLLGVLAAAAVAALFGAVVALTTVRLRGLYLALATLAFAYAMELAFFPNVLGGGGSVRVARPHLPGVPRTDRAYFIELAVVFALGGIAVLAVRRGRLGRRLACMDDSPAACATLGVNINWTKLWVFTVASAMAGIGGALKIAVPGQGTTNDFVLLLSLTLLLLARVGGINTVTGVFLGAAFFTTFTILQEHVGWLARDQIQYLLTGLAAISLGRDPNGLGGQVATAAARIRARWESRTITPPSAPLAPAPTAEEHLAGV